MCVHVQVLVCTIQYSLSVHLCYKETNLSYIASCVSLYSWCIHTGTEGQEEQADSMQSHSVKHSLHNYVKFTHTAQPKQQDDHNEQQRQQVAIGKTVLGNSRNE